jgi:hypothetical protein
MCSFINHLADLKSKSLQGMIKAMGFPASDQEDAMFHCKEQKFHLV